MLIGNNLKPGWTSHRIRRCQIRLGDTKQLTVYYYTPNDIHERSDRIVPFSSGKEWHADICDKESLKQHIHHGDVVPFSISIDPAAPGIRAADQYITEITDMLNLERVDFTILRNPFTKAISLHTYLTSDASKHEPTHGSIMYDQLSDYLESYQLEDSWLIRDLMNMSDEQHITQNHYDTCVSIMSRWTVGDLCETDNIIDDVFGKCYGIVRSDVESHVVDVFRNETTNKPNVKWSDLSTETQQKFLSRTHWDRKLWQRYCSND